MKSIVSAFMMFIAFADFSLATECRDKFISITTDVKQKGPLKMLVTSYLNGKKTMESNFFQAGLDHWLNEGISPKGMPSTLAYSHSMYNSFDSGKSWKKVGKLDAEKGRREAFKQLLEDV